MSVIVRPATAADVDTLRELWDEFCAALDEPAWLAQSWDEVRDEIERDVGEGGVLVAEEEEGAVVAYVRLELESPRLALIEDVYVRPAARHRGVATALLVAAAELLRARGATHAALEADLDETGAVALYRRLGFTPFSRNLAVALDDLVRRAAPAPAGETFGAVHVRGADAASVERGARQFLPRLGRSQGTRFAERGGWVSVYDELCDREPRHLRRLARELSDRMGNVVLALGVEEGAVARYVLYDRGAIADEYASVPEYHGPLPPGDVVALAANPRVAERLAGADAAALREVARTATSPAELPPAGDLAAAIAAAFGLDGPVGYRDGT